MGQPLISVIVPVYNTESHLRRCVDSILAQTFTDFEVLLIDDGSEDGSGGICDEYATRDSRIKVFHKENGGVSSARNLGIDNACGEWIAFADSDDYVTGDWLEIYYGLIGGCDMIVQGLRTDKPLYPSSPQDRMTYGIDFCGETSEALSRLHAECLIGYCHVRLLDKSLIDRFHLRFNTNIVLREDMEFILRYMTHCKFVRCTKKAGYCYFVPNWAKKWGDVETPLDLPRSIYKSIKEIFGRQNLITNAYLQAYFQALLSALKQGKATRHDIITFRNDSKQELLSSPIFLISKYAISLDPTSFISYIVLKMHTLSKP